MAYDALCGGIGRYGVMRALRCRVAGTRYVSMRGLIHVGSRRVPSTRGRRPVRACVATPVRVSAR
eukprot:1727149-Prymnesium_polylepis.1